MRNVRPSSCLLSVWLLAGGALIGAVLLDNFLDLTRPRGRIVSTRTPPSSLHATKAEETHKSTDGVREGLPEWINNYFAWHRQMREQFPGRELLRNKTAPNILLWNNVNGLHDRLHDVPLALYLANQTQRLLFIHWTVPAPLEEFLVPNLIDWSVPDDTELKRRLNSAPRLFPTLPSRMADLNPTNFWDRVLDEGIQRGLAGENKVFFFAQHLKTHGDIEFTKRLESVGEMDPIYQTPTYTALWHAFFQPSPPLQEYIDETKKSLGLQKGRYVAVHCRSRFPAHFRDERINGMLPFAEPDKTGLVFKGHGKDKAVALATHALQCAQTLLTDKTEAIYFFSDSSNLTAYMTHNNNNSNSHNAVGRLDVDNDESLHLGRQMHGHVPRDYFSTFADLYMAIEARCVVYGLGGFGKFGAEISNTPCQLQHHHKTKGSLPCPP